jgi:hypothetical protein
MNGRRAEEGVWRSSEAIATAAAAMSGLGSAHGHHEPYLRITPSVCPLCVIASP